MVWARLLAAGLIAIVALSACDDDEDAARTSLTGPVVAVDSKGLDDVTSFEIQSGGKRYTIYIDPDVDYNFPLGHLGEHRATGEPVTVELEERDGKIYAQSIEDAED
ncbi:MAG: hypothetical protein ACRDJI_01410 [Actinomycetota bacterium]